MATMYENAKVKFPPKTGTNANGEWAMIKVAHDNLPKNEKGYRDATVFGHKDQIEFFKSLKPGDTVTVFEENGKFTVETVEQDPGKPSAPASNRPQPTPTYTLDELVGVWCDAYRAVEARLSDNGNIVTEETLRGAATTIFITKTGR